MFTNRDREELEIKIMLSIIQHDGANSNTIIQDSLRIADDYIKALPYNRQKNSNNSEPAESNILTAKEPQYNYQLFTLPLGMTGEEIIPEIRILQIEGWEIICQIGKPESMCFLFKRQK